MSSKSRSPRAGSHNNRLVRWLQFAVNGQTEHPRAGRRACAIPSLPGVGSHV